MNLLAELNRRNVIRAAAAYLVSAWLLIEVGSLLFEIFVLPRWASQLLVILLALGLVPALVFAWVYELTPEGLKRQSELDASAGVSPLSARRLDQIAILMVVLALGVVLIRTMLPHEPQTVDSAANSDTHPAPLEPMPRSGTASEEDPRVDPQSVAVLPFVNMSSDPENEYFSDGIAEELLNMLVGIDDLRVPSRTSSFAFKGQNVELKEIADALKVAHVVEGSVRKSGDRVRITAQLIDVASDTHLWSRTFDRQLTDIFAIQDEIAAEILKALQVVIGQETMRPPQSMAFESYDRYLQGLYLFRNRNAEALPESERLLTEVVEREPEFAQAWATLALVHLMMPNYNRTAWEEVAPRVRAEAERALDLNPTLADARLALAQQLSWENRWIELFAAFEALIDDHPRHALARQWFGVTLLGMGYLQQSLEQLETAYDLDPVSGVTLDWLARAQLLNGQVEMALASAQQAVLLGREIAYATPIYHHMGAREFEIVESEILGRAQWPYLPAIVDAVRDPDRIPELREGLPSPGQQYFDLLTALYLKRPDAYFQALRRIIRFDLSVLFGLWGEPFAVLRQDPEMRSFARDIGMLDLWMARGWPDRCRPVEGQAFACD